VSEAREIKKLAGQYGYPLVIKASAGGGGRGLKIVKSEADVEGALAGAQREGLSYFSSNEVYLEKYLDSPKHVEVQVLADSFGSVIHLGERDCSVQRRQQKLLEESPAPTLSSALREQALTTAIASATACGYTCAGTFEGLVVDGNYYLLEVNARIQVEHPVTEMVTGIDIVKEQILIAAGHRLSLDQSSVSFRGHAIECRINAEDPLRDFLPSPGVITHYKEPCLAWVRIDAGAYPGYEVLPYYDSLLAKLIVWGRNRDEAIARMRCALDSFVIEGVATTLPFQRALLRSERFVNGDFSTQTVESDFLPSFKSDQSITRLGWRSGAAARQSIGGSDIDNSGPIVRNFEVAVNNQAFRVVVKEVRSSATRSEQDELSQKQTQASTKQEKQKRKNAGEPLHTGEKQQEVFAPMHGLVKKIDISEGQLVEVGQSLLVFEAMKMETEIKAQIAGRVNKLSVRVGETVEDDAHLLTVVKEPSRTAGVGGKS